MLLSGKRTSEMSVLSALPGSRAPASTLELSEIPSELSCLASLEVGKDSKRVLTCYAKLREEDTCHAEQRLPL